MINGLKPVDDAIMESVKFFRMENDYYPTISELRQETGYALKVIIKSLTRLQNAGKVSVIDIRRRDSIIVI